MIFEVDEGTGQSARWVSKLTTEEFHKIASLVNDDLVTAAFENCFYTCAV